MANRFLKVSRGIANTVIYFCVPEKDVDAANKQFDPFADENPGCYTQWVSGQGLGDRPVNWADRAYFGY